MVKHRIAILLLERQRGQTLSYHINQFADIWRADGHEVVELFGVRQFIPADLLFVHVDLSVVPEEYLEFAKQYPIVVNGAVKDIRKSTFSKIIVRPGDGYAGSVIVKSNYNFAGCPERYAGVVPIAQEHGIDFHSPKEYLVYRSREETHPSVFTDPDLIVEQFVPEISEGQFVMRAMQFLGNRLDCLRFVSSNPIVNGSTRTELALVEPHPDIVALRNMMKFDYGKFDYVIHDGKAILLDANKTVGAPFPGANAEILASRRARAKGIYDYF